MKKIALIAPIEKLANIARQVVIANDYDNIEILEGNLEQGVEQARRAIAAGAKIIISRGGTYRRIKAEFNVPVIEIKVTALDLIESFKAAKQTGETGIIGVIGFENVINGADLVAEVMGLKIDCFKPHRMSDVAPELNRMAQQGIKTFVGDANVLRVPEKYFCSAFVVNSGPQAMGIAIENAHAALLELQIEERTAELAEANKKLTHTVATLQRTQSILVETEKIASLGRLVAGVAHELNTPIGNALLVVSGVKEIEKEIYAAITSGQVRKSQILAYLERVEEGHQIASSNLHRAAEIIQDFKQLAVDQTSAMRRPFDLATVIDEALNSLRPRFKHTPYRIEVDLARDIRMDSYPGPLGQVLTNLVMNTLTHAFEGRENGVVSIISQRLGDDRVSLVCSDNGVGMDEETLRKIYDPFFSSKMGQGGSGLGLHIVHTMLTGLLNGQIKVQSQPGQGTRFSMVLPLVVAPVRPPD